MNTYQPELALNVRRKRYRRLPQAAKAFFDLGKRLRREVETEELQRIRGHGE
jgi:hypothetical protein